MKRKEKVLVLCENAAKGCPLQFEEQDRSKHMTVCLYERTKCENCGLSVLLRDLVLHQKVKRCNEKLVQRLKIEHAKQVHEQVVGHFRRLHAQTSGRHVANYKWYKSIAHKKNGWTTPVPPAWSSRVASALQSARDHETKIAVKDERIVQSARPVLFTDEKCENKDVALRDVTNTQEQVRPTSARTICEGAERCLRCRKLFRTELNHGRACHWHRGV